MKTLSDWYVQRLADEAMLFAREAPAFCQHMAASTIAKAHERTGNHHNVAQHRRRPRVRSAGAGLVVIKIND
ncbi:hypothetical protein [Caballeronia calidae]|uniref:hypothetical protein n=1 Tax=Caballeronia calidae TaxID=1777139 RepID=UPI0007899BA7|nr:hypothetical protein [Caballeronia calidae]